VIVVSGELDVASSQELERELARVSDAALIVIDLSPVTFIDSTGLGIVISAHQRAMELGHRLAVVRGGGQVDRLLSLTGLDEQLLIGDSADELLAG
jgi:anti-sigma B factor antagonist